MRGTFLGMKGDVNGARRNMNMADQSMSEDAEQGDCGRRGAPTRAGREERVAGVHTVTTRTSVVRANAPLQGGGADETEMQEVRT